MELMNETLAQIISEQILKMSMLETYEDLQHLAKDRYFLALKEIKAILEDDSLSDFLCVEKIVRVYERMGSGCGCRHDF